MRNFTNLLKFYTDKKQSTCPSFVNENCKEQFCKCKISAEIWTYIDTIIPESYRRQTIDDFVGMTTEGHAVLSAKAVKHAKAQCMNYCWDVSKIKPGMSYDASWLNHTLMPKRLANGNNLIIYGDPWSSKNKAENNFPQTFRKKLGRTLLASIVMREAIFQRIKTNHMEETYGWYSYNKLLNKLMEDADGKSDHSSEIDGLIISDWLVIDGFELQKVSDNAKNFRISVLEKFFSERVERNLPTIIVFQDDISKIGDIRSEYGYAIEEIVTAKKTHSIVLKEDK